MLYVLYLFFIHYIYNIGICDCVCVCVCVTRSTYMLMSLSSVIHDSYPWGRSAAKVTATSHILRRAQQVVVECLAFRSGVSQHGVLLPMTWSISRCVVQYRLLYHWQIRTYIHIVYMTCL